MTRVTHKITGKRVGRKGTRWSENPYSSGCDNIIEIKFNNKPIFKVELEFDEYGIHIPYITIYEVTELSLKQILKRERYLNSLINDRLRIDDYIDCTDYSKLSYYYKKRYRVWSRCYGYKRCVGRHKHLTRKKGWKIV